MDLKYSVTFLLVLVIQIIRITLGHPHFRSRIPNGYHVPHPCDVMKPEWRGVGHVNRNGGGDRNPFGEAFAANGFVWTSLLCRADSDGDGKTNGQELGDPNCEWVPGEKPDRPAQSHPGICDPLDIQRCVDKNEFLYCENETFTCDALRNKDTFSKTVQFPLIRLGVTASTYMCMDFDFPFDEEHHIVATKPLVNLSELVHSIHVYSKLVVRQTHPLNEPYLCSSDDLFFEGLISVWQRGAGGECHHGNMGMQVGGQFGHRYATMQIHWLDVDPTRGLEDNPGLVFYLTSTLRSHHAGYFQLGPRYLEIPSQTRDHAVTARLEPACSRMVLQDVYITTVLGQMQHSGHNLTLTLSRDGQIVNYLAVEDQYDHANVRQHRFVKPIKVKPGDELSVTCSYDTTKRSVTTFWGDGAEDEKCQVAIGYYPNENIRVPRAFTYGSISYCDYLSGEYKGCDLHMLTNPAKHVGQGIIKTVSEKCRPGICLPECLKYVKNLKQTACFYGDANKLIRHPFNMEMTEELMHVRLFAAIDSCDSKLAHEQCEIIQFGNHASRHVICSYLLLMITTGIGQLIIYS